MIHIVYFSAGGNTAKFADKLLADPRLAPHISATRIFSRGFHAPQIGYATYRQGPAPQEPTKTAGAYDPWVRQDDTLLVLVPSYGRFDRELGRTVDFTPECLKPYLEIADGAVFFGNRNFGADFCAAEKELPLRDFESKREWDKGESMRVLAVRKIELAGTKKDLDSVVNWLLAAR